MSKSSLKINFAVQKKYGAFYQGGRVQVSSSGSHLFCQCGNQVQVLQVQSGHIQHTIGQDVEDEVTCFVLSPDEQCLVVATRGLLLKQWDWRTNTVTRTWKAIHTGPVTCMTFDRTSTLLATGGSDATVKVWDVVKQYCTHNLRGHHGVISVVEFHPDTERLQLFTAGEDYKIRVWDLRTSSLLAALESHYSVITSLQFSADGSTLLSSGRDSVVTVWDVTTNSFDKKRTIPVYEVVESILVLPQNANPALNVATEELHFLTAGSKGVIRVWNSNKSNCVYTQKHISTQDEDSEAGESSSTIIQPIIHAEFCASLDSIITVTFDQNIIFHKADDLTLYKHLIGNNDDVLDVALLGAEESHLAVATNSALVQVFNRETWDCQVLRGHTDIVMTLSVSHDHKMLVTGSKDNSIRLWTVDGSNIECVAQGHGHTHAVNAVVFSRLSGSFVVSGGQDCTMKLWPVPTEYSGFMHTLVSKATEHAHDKDINSITVAPNDKLLCSASQDRTAKLWNASDLSLLGVFRGHKRGIWDIQFSPVDQCIVTASADGTLKIWAISDFTCVKTFEGHDSSVLKVAFLSRGMQLLSTGSDGLMKLWTIKSNECIGTFDEHADKAWAMAVSNDQQTVITGAADANIIIWKDVTEVELAEAQASREEFILQEQELSNLVQGKRWLKALRIAITLDQPFKVLTIMKAVLADGTDGHTGLKNTLSKLRDDQLAAVLGFAAKWNMNSKHCHVAQLVLTAALMSHTPQQLSTLPNIRETMQTFIPYTERHFERMNRLLQQSTFVDYTWQCMKLGTQETVHTELGDEGILVDAEELS